MAGQDLNRSIKIFIDGSDAAQGIQPVQEAIGKLEQRLAALNKSEADYEEKSKRLKSQLESKNRTLVNYQKKIEGTDRVLKDLSGATYKELLAVRSQIRKSLENEVRGTARYNAAMEQNRRVTEALTRAQKEMRVEIGCQGTVLARTANFINKYAGLFTTGIAAMTGLDFAIRGTVKAYAEMQEAESQVIKYTGMTKDEVAALNEELKKMDTRTARDKLNELAGEAGRLGITSKEAVMEFIDAADKINVALGEDLGDEAVGNIGKLAKMFGEDERMGLRGAMLATGSAINEVAQNSSAAERYLVDFTARVAGVANQAGIAQSDIIGFAASMDENMLRNETSATAYQNILLKMMTDTEKFAKVAGLSMKEFGELVRTDANEALLVFAKALSDKGGMADLAPIFGDLQTEGAGVASVLAVLAGKAEEVRERQELANKAYHDGTSILNEFDVQNNTVQAGLDKAKKKFSDLSIELGEKLMPLMSHLISGASLLVRSLDVVTTFIINHVGSITTLTATIAGYQIALKAIIVQEKLLYLWKSKNILVSKARAVLLAAEKGAILALAGAQALLTGNITKATAAMRLFNAVTKLNPFGLLLSVIAAAGTGLYMLINRTDNLTKSLKDMNAELLKEQVSLDALFGALNRLNPGSEERKKIIQQINNAYGQYLPKLLSEKSSLDEIKLAYERINTALTEQIALKFKNQAISDATTEHVKDQVESLDTLRQSMEPVIGSLSTYAVDELKKVTAEYYAAGQKWQDAYGQAYRDIQRKYFGSKSMHGIAASDMADYVKSYYKMQQDIAKINKKYDVWMPKKKPNELDEVVVTAPKKQTASVTSVTPGGSDDEIKEALKKRQSLYQREQAALMKLYVSGKDAELRTEQQYNARLLAMKEQYLNDVIKIAGATSEQGAAAQKQLGDIALQANDQQMKLMRQQRDKEIERENNDYKIRMSALQNQEKTGLLTKQQYQIFAAAAASKHADNLLSIERKCGEQAIALMKSNGGNMTQLIDEQNERIATSTDVAAQRRIEAEETYMQNVETLREMANQADTSPEAREQSAYDLKKAELEGIYQASIEYAKKTGQDTAEIEENYRKATENLEREHAENLAEIRNKQREDLIHQLNDPLQQQLMSAYDAVADLKDLMDNVANYTEEEFRQRLVMCIGQLVNTVTAGLSSAFATFKRIEMDNIEAKYNKELELAAGDPEKIKQIERKKAEQKLEVEKKYADVQFVIKASQIVANTAMAISLCLAQLGPIAGPAMAGVMAAAGAVQLAAAEAEREKVKSQTLDGVSSVGSGSRVAIGKVPQHASGKYDVIGEEDGQTYRDVPYIGTPSGIVSRPALISESGAELIVNADDLRRLQQHINYPLVLQAISDARRGYVGGGVVPQYAGGSYPATVSAPAGTAIDPAVLVRLTTVLERLDSDGLKASVVLSEMERKQKLLQKSRELGKK